MGYPEAEILSDTDSTVEDHDDNPIEEELD